MTGDVGLLSGHVLWADWMFLLAAIVFVVEVIAIVTARPAVSRGILAGVGLALLAVGWLVL
jgi:hypothetical protein